MLCKYFSKILLGLAAFAWTACSSDSGTGAEGSVPIDSSSSQGESSNSVEQMSSSSQKVSLTRKNFFNVDSLITTCFLKDMNDFAAFNEVYAQYFTKNPARSCVEVSNLPKGAKAECECIARR